MQTFVEFEVIFIKSENETLVGLGIETEKEYFTDKGVIDISRVEAYWKCDRVHNEMETINVQLQSGEIFTLAFPFDKFSKLMK